MIIVFEINIILLVFLEIELLMKFPLSFRNIIYLFILSGFSPQDIVLGLMSWFLQN